MSCLEHWEPDKTPRCLPKILPRAYRVPPTFLTPSPPALCQIQRGCLPVLPFCPDNYPRVRPAHLVPSRSLLEREPCRAELRPRTTLLVTALLLIWAFPALPCFEALTLLLLCSLLVWPELQEEGGPGQGHR